MFSLCGLQLQVAVAVTKFRAGRRTAKTVTGDDTAVTKPNVLHGSGRMPGDVFSRSLAAFDDVLQDGCCAHAVGPAGVERQVQQGFPEFLVGDAVLPGKAEVKLQLIHLAQRRQRGDRDQAAVTL